MSGNYQSRVFTFISKRTNRLKDTCAQGFRQIKVAVVWSGQALLYPFHLLAQTTKIFQPQIAPPAQKPVLAPVSDINIEQALELIVDAGYPIVIAECGSLTVADAREYHRQQQVSTGGGSIIASEDSSSLGYYDPDTDDWEVASYSPRRSQQVIAKNSVIQGLSSRLVDRQLVLITTENEILDILTSSQQQEIRRRIGLDLAIDWYQWNTGEILDRHLPDQLSLNHQTTTKQRSIASSEARSTPNLFDQLQDWLKNITAKSESSIISSSDLATAQIESKLPPQIAPASYLFRPQPPQIERFLDLPQLPPINEPESLVIVTNPIWQTLIELQPKWLKQWWSYYRDYLSISPTGFNEFQSSQIIHQPEEFQLTRIEQHRENRSEKVTSNNRFAISDTIQTSEITHSHRQSTQNYAKLDRKIFQNVEFNPDWIETEAEQIGYSKSLITIALEWIDRLILQIENWLIKIWNLITNNQSKI
ncbi:MAG: hypothetical protein LH474_09060 [Chamaesiphon sp.]|nr:hypothetical protein [Chamaesiphon sp.]